MSKIQAQIIHAKPKKKPTTAETIASLSERLMSKNNAKIQYKNDFCKQIARRV
jgi:hypothetical protein